VLGAIDPSTLSIYDRNDLDSSKVMTARLMNSVENKSTISSIPKSNRFLIRKDIMLLNSHVKSLVAKTETRLSKNDKEVLSTNLKKVRTITDYSPKWVIILIAVSLGLGTMIGWKRIVKTIGEKIGKEHLTYAQGASAELVAATTIGLSTGLGLPVSTTHVLSSGIAGSMVASKGIKNLQPDTVRNILIAWLLTLPVVMVMAGTLFLIFRSVF
jgi:phosphate/sulfate permease